MNKKELKKIIRECIKEINENQIFRGKKGDAVRVKFFNSLEGKNDEQEGIIVTPQNTQVSVRLKNFETIIVPWEYVTPDLKDPDPNKDWRTKPKSTGW